MCAAPACHACRVDLTLRGRKVAPSLESLEEGQVGTGAQGLAGAGLMFGPPPRFVFVLLLLLLLVGLCCNSAGGWADFVCFCPARPAHHHIRCSLQVVRGVVKRVAAFGVFVELDGSPGVTGATPGHGLLCMSLFCALCFLGLLATNDWPALPAHLHTLPAPCPPTCPCVTTVHHHLLLPRPPLVPAPMCAAAGLAHVSEVADEFVKDLEGLFNPGQREWGCRVTWCPAWATGAPTAGLPACDSTLPSLTLSTNDSCRRGCAGA